jgi:hypothetical protein
MDEGDGGKRTRDEQEDEQHEDPYTPPTAESKASKIVQDYVSSAWIFELIPGRLYCGPMPRRMIEGYFLTQKLGVTHFVNIAAPHDAADDVTRYFKWWDDFETRRPTMTLAFSIPEKMVLTMTDPTPVYAQAAQDIIVPAMRASPAGVFYIHNRLGYEEEATLAMLVWRMLDKMSFPSDLEAWFEKRNRSRMLDEPEQREQLAGAVARVGEMAAGASAAGGMNRFLTRTPRPAKK